MRPPSGSPPPAPDEPLIYNPLYIHAFGRARQDAPAAAVAHTVTAQKRRVIYLTAEKFMYGFVLALKAQTSLAFKERMRGIDILIIDDVQFLQGKSIQQEFCHTINALIDARKQIIIAADRPPADLESSRGAGALAPVGRPVRRDRSA